MDPLRVGVGAETAETQATLQETVTEVRRCKPAGRVVTEDDELW